MAFAVSGVIYVVQNPAPAILTTNNNPNPISAKPLVEPLNISEIQSKIGHGDNQPLVAESSVANQDSENLTETFTKKISDAIAQNNPTGTTKIGDKPQLNVPDPDSIADSILTDAAANFDPNSLKPIIKDSDIKISQDNSREALLTYMSSFQEIIRGAANEIPSGMLIREPTIEDADPLMTIYRKAANKFYNLTVPSSLINIHKKEIALLIAKKNVFEKTKNYQKDPLSAVLAGQALEIIDSEFLQLSEDFKSFIKNKI